jgi:hypothetical protein
MWKLSEKGMQEGCHPETFFQIEVAVDISEKQKCARGHFT